MCVGTNTCTSCTTGGNGVVPTSPLGSTSQSACACPSPLYYRHGAGCFPCGAGTTETSADSKTCTCLAGHGPSFNSTTGTCDEVCRLKDATCSAGGLPCCNGEQCINGVCGGICPAGTYLTGEQRPGQEGWVEYVARSQAAGLGVAKCAMPFGQTDPARPVFAGLNTCTPCAGGALSPDGSTSQSACYCPAPADDTQPRPFYQPSVGCTTCSAAFTSGTSPDGKSCECLASYRPGSFNATSNTCRDSCFSVGEACSASSQCCNAQQCLGGTCGGSCPNGTYVVDGESMSKAPLLYFAPMLYFAA